MLLRPLMDRLLRPTIFAAFLGALVCLVYIEVTFGLKAFVLRDYGIFGYPLAAYQKHAFWQGEFPLWNPFNSSGIPFFAQWNTMVLYPGSVIYLLLPMPWAHGVFMLGHQFAAAFGMYVLARRWTGSAWGAAAAGVIYGFNGLIMGALMWPNNIAALGWMPWVVLATVRAAKPIAEWRAALGRVAICALAGACQLFTGAPEIIGFTWIIALVAICATISKTELLGAFGRAGLALVLTGLLGAIQLLPFLELLGQSQRSSTFGGADWSMPLWGWANLLAPLFRFYRSPQGVFFQTDQEWTSSYYFGALALLLIPIALSGGRARWWWLALMAGSFLLALGPAGKVWAWLKTALPLLGFVRFPIKFIVPIIFGAAALAAYGLASIEKKEQSAPTGPKFPRLLLGSAVALGVVMIGIVAWSHAKPIPYEEPRAVLLNGAIRLALLGGFTCVLIMIARGDERTWLKPIAVTLIAADLITHAPRQNTLAETDVYAASVSRQGALTELGLEHGRAFQTRAAHDRFYFEMRPDPTGDYLGRRLGLYGNANLLDQIPSVDGFFSLYLPWQRQLWEKLFLAPTNAFPTGLAQLMGVAAMSSPASPVEWVRPDFKALPILSAGQAARRMDEAEIVPALSDPSFDPFEIVYVVDETFPSSEKAAVSVQDAQHTAHKITARITAASPTTLLMTQSWHPAWRAKVNGQDARIARANHAFQAIAIPVGESRVEFIYHDHSFKRGAWVSTSALALCGGCLFIARRKAGGK